MTDTSTEKEAIQPQQTQQDTGEKTDEYFIDERFADIQMLRYDVPCFDKLTLRRKLLIYYLTEAALAGRDILWDQNCQYNLPLRKTLEAIYGNYSGDKDCTDYRHFLTYLKRVWFSNGIHHHYGYSKFKPLFSREFFLRELEKVPTSLLPIPEGQARQDFERLMDRLVFDTDFMQKRVNQTDGEDLVATSACNYYAQGITQHEAEIYYNSIKAAQPTDRPVMYGLNGRLERNTDGTLTENVWRKGGMYGKAISRITTLLEQAMEYAESETQANTIRQLVRFYETGDLALFDTYNIMWVQDTDSEIDFTNGFIETYGDPLGIKASWEGYANIVDKQSTMRTTTLSQNAQWFEDNSPVDTRFKKAHCTGVSAKVVNAAILGGDLYPSSAIGINLPNSNWIRAEHGSKSVTIGNLTHAYRIAAKGSGLTEEFTIDKATKELIDMYGETCDNLHTDLHECLGHGSGQLLPGVDPDALKAYGSTIEEARADLFGLYYMPDDKMTELGLTPDTEAYKALYYSYLTNGLLTQTARIAEGEQIEEAHMRNRALIAHWTLRHYPQAVGITERESKHYVEIYDYPALRNAFGVLLSEIQRIKSTGDLEAARRLVEEYGVKIDQRLHKEVRERYAKLNIAPFKGFINPRYTLVRDKDGQAIDVAMDCTETYTRQMLRYGKEYSTI